MNCQKALRDGMVFRSFEDTARDVLEWDNSRPADEERLAGISLEEEKALLNKWKAAA
jgi:2'-hydroxyisoflavone reductase